MNLANIDLKLLVVFDAMMAEGSVNRAAEKLGMSQPALSNALNRLRLLLNDRLFLRTADGMRPTPRALEIAGPIQAAMRQIEEALEPTVFEPNDPDWTFNLAVSDHASVVMLPLLIEHVARVAPQVALKIQSRPNEELPALLDNSEIDLAVGVIPNLPRRFKHIALFEDKYLCMMRQGHPLAGQPITLDEFLAAEQLAVKPGMSDVSRADRFLAEAGLKRRVATTVHQFLAAPAIVSRSDLIVMVFEKMVPIFDPSRFYFCPVPVPNMRVFATAVWSDVHTDVPAHKWLRRQLALVARQLAEETGAEGLALSAAS
ncbi:LysR family transcriptional regulator [Neorhizobium petrolearium]|uniref:LysR family transcriptional regulator n=1 Tax=Neorhizobium petrolearium TaxID=515361 RepID=A0ABY8MAN5_9HYPH|nr:LysR family transcriptional regulator [Neorhizobium petrolearium]MCC2614029.1 LysR family transcriptional regulator [Neorhizobium petrolearium]WGI71548.1 LysR family transcriptional regulator [Neorhizobium petrolearium]